MQQLGYVTGNSNIQVCQLITAPWKTWIKFICRPDKKVISRTLKRYKAGREYFIFGGERVYYMPKD